MLDQYQKETDYDPPRSTQLIFNLRMANNQLELDVDTDMIIKKQ